MQELPQHILEKMTSDQQVGYSNWVENYNLIDEIDKHFDQRINEGSTEYRNYIINMTIVAATVLGLASILENNNNVFTSFGLVALVISVIFGLGYVIWSKETSLRLSNQSYQKAREDGLEIIGIWGEVIQQKYSSEIGYQKVKEIYDAIERRIITTDLKRDYTVWTIFFCFTLGLVSLVLSAT